MNTAMSRRASFVEARFVGPANRAVVIRFLRPRMMLRRLRCSVLHDSLPRLRDLLFPKKKICGILRVTEESGSKPSFHPFLHSNGVSFGRPSLLRSDGPTDPHFRHSRTVVNVFALTLHTSFLLPGCVLFASSSFRSSFLLRARKLSPPFSLFLC